MDKHKSTILTLFLSIFFFFFALGYFYLEEFKKGFIWLATIWGIIILFNSTNSDYFMIILFIVFFYTLYDCYKISKITPQHKKKMKALPTINKEYKGKNSKNTSESINQIKEYKRKCKECGKVWHSLVDREEKLQKDVKCSGCIGASTAFSGNLGASAQANRSAQAQQTTLEEIKKCPDCGSGNYEEKVITYEKK